MSSFSLSRASTCLCIVYVSEGIRNAVINKLRDTAVSSTNVLLAHSYQDSTYNRTSFFLLSDKSVYSHALKLCSEAYQMINFSDHSGTHPTLGVVDHVCFFPLGTSTLNEAREEARAFALTLSTTQNIPVFLYGAASDTNIRLRELRKSLGYFTQTGGAIHDPIMSISPDFGVPVFDVKKGLTCVGAVDFVQNFNIRFAVEHEKRLVAQVTQYVREEKVEALTLQHEEGAFEVACNLLQPAVKSPAYVLSRAEAKARELGLTITSSYTLGPSEAELLDLLLSK